MKKVSELLKEEREIQKLSLEDIEHKTKINKSFLTAIEDGKFSKLPSESYALGFVKNYAEVLGLNVERISALFRREYAHEMPKIIPEFRKTQHRFRRKLLFGPKGLFVALIFLIIIGYLFFQYNSVIFGPDLAVDTPANSQTIEGNVVEVKGKSDPYATVLVNGEEVYVGLDGNFRKSLYLFSGTQKITVIAKNRYGKETVVTRTVSLK